MISFAKLSASPQTYGLYLAKAGSDKRHRGMVCHGTTPT
jgi:hypothetical protein